MRAVLLFACLFVFGDTKSPKSREIHFRTVRKDGKELTSIPKRFLHERRGVRKVLERKFYTCLCLRFPRSHKGLNLS